MSVDDMNAAATTRRRVDPFGLVALAAAGTMTAHQLASLVAPASTVSHGYLGVVGPALVLVVCLAAWVTALRVVGSDPGRAPTWVQLSGLQVTLFVAMEVAERAVDGAPSIVSSTVLVGLLLQPLVASVSLRLLRTGRRVIERLLRDDPPLLAVFRPLLGGSYAQLLVGAVSLPILRLRGPPAV